MAEAAAALRQTGVDALRQHLVAFNPDNTVESVVCTQWHALASFMHFHAQDD